VFKLKIPPIKKSQQYLIKLNLGFLKSKTKIIEELGKQTGKKRMSNNVLINDLIVKNMN